MNAGLATKETGMRHGLSGRLNKAPEALFAAGKGTPYQSALRACQ